MGALHPCMSCTLGHCPSADLPERNVDHGRGAAAGLEAQHQRARLVAAHKRLQAAPRARTTVVHHAEPRSAGSTCPSRAQALGKARCEPAVRACGNGKQGMHAGSVHTILADSCGLHGQASGARACADSCCSSGPTPSTAKSSPCTATRSAGAAASAGTACSSGGASCRSSALPDGIAAVPGAAAAAALAGAVEAHAVQARRCAPRSSHGAACTGARRRWPVLLPRGDYMLEKRREARGALWLRVTRWEVRPQYETRTEHAAHSKEHGTRQQNVPSHDAHGTAAKDPRQPRAKHTLSFTVQTGFTNSSGRGAGQEEPNSSASSRQTHLAPAACARNVGACHANISCFSAVQKTPFALLRT